mmetsp:Transcript_5639/g.23133  ORF Transcript_5639/g.23133 Transcript_5639/m.23133 type:complete len:262 (-) Transcript_5639:840-1625(-)
MHRVQPNPRRAPRRQRQRVAAGFAALGREDATRQLPRHERRHGVEPEGLAEARLENRRARARPPPRGAGSTFKRILRVRRKTRAKLPLRDGIAREPKQRPRQRRRLRVVAREEESRRLVQQRVPRPEPRPSIDRRSPKPAKNPTPAPSPPMSSTVRGAAAQVVEGRAGHRGSKRELRKPPCLADPRPLETTHGRERVRPVGEHPHAPRAGGDQTAQICRRGEVLVLPNPRGAPSPRARVPHHRRVQPAAELPVAVRRGGGG